MHEHNKSKNLSTKIVTSTKNVTHNMNSETFKTEQPTINDHGSNYQLNTKDRLGVMALVAIMEPATDSQSSRVITQPLEGCPSNKIKVLLDSRSNGDLCFLPKGKDKPFPYLIRQVPKSWHTSIGSFQTNGRAKIRVKFFDCLAGREYTLLPDVVEYDEATMSKPGFDLILGSNTLKELGIVLDFWTREITLDDISPPMHCKQAVSKLLVSC